MVHLYLFMILVDTLVRLYVRYVNNKLYISSFYFYIYKYKYIKNETY